MFEDVAYIAGIRTGIIDGPSHLAYSPKARTVFYFLNLGALV